MTLSVVIPTWTGTDELEDMAFKLCESVREQCDDLVVTEDGGKYSERIKKIADQYLYHRWNIGDLRNIVLGMWMAEGDFVAVLNSDVTWHRGSLRDLCIPGRVVSPLWRQNRERRTVLDFCFVVDRQILRDKNYGYFATDRDVGPGWTWFESVKNVSDSVDIAEVSHHGGTSYGAKHKLEYEEASRRAASAINREIDPRRHIQRLLSDPEYASIWANEEERQA
jgi:hypothetical protein